MAYKGVVSHYVVLQDISVTGLARQVEEFLRDGWVCQGGAVPAIVSLSKERDSFIAEWVWMQTMTKPFVGIAVDKITELVSRVPATPVA